MQLETSSEGKDREEQREEEELRNSFLSHFVIINQGRDTLAATRNCRYAN